MLLGTAEPVVQVCAASYLSNFTGIPTDCPHREKNGWTGDAQIACEAGLWNYNSVRAYKHFIQMLVDAQRPSGQLPGIVPTGGWGYNWGSGPAWDSALFEIPFRVLRYYGDDEMIRLHYEAMRRYIDFLYRHVGELPCKFRARRLVCAEPRSGQYCRTYFQRLLLL